MQAQYSENYTFSRLSDDGVEVFVNGQEVISDLQPQSPAPRKQFADRAESRQELCHRGLYFQAGGGAEMTLSWSSPHTPQEIIPQSQLFSGSAPAAPTNLQVAAISGTQSELTWTTNSTDEDGYEVDRMLGSSGTFSPVAFLPPGSEPVPGYGPDPGQYLHVRGPRRQFRGQLGLVQPGWRYSARSARCRFRRDGHDGDRQIDLDGMDA